LVSGISFVRTDPAIEPDIHGLGTVLRYVPMEQVSDLPTYDWELVAIEIYEALLVL
jgi:hypothetical protein